MATGRCPPNPARTRTVFNLLGPLSNPAGAKRQLLGVFAKEWIGPMAEVLLTLGSEAAWVVHGSDGIDEITTTGTTYVAELKGGRITRFEITPEDAGLPRAKTDQLKGSDAAGNAAALTSVLAGMPGAYRDIVILNSAAALIVAGKATTLTEGAAMASRAIDDGLARKTLDRLVAITSSGQPKQ